MTDTKRIRALRAIVSLIAALPFPIVTLVLVAGFSPVDRLDSSLILDYGGLVAAGGLLLAWGAYFLVLGQPTPLRFAFMGAACAVAALGVTFWFSVAVHRDWFSALFIEPIAFWCLALFWLQTKPTGITRQGLGSFGVASLVVFAFFTVWIMLMGWAIVTRAEPRPIEAIIYNAYNMVLAFMLAILSRTAYLATKRVLEVGQAGIFLDGSPVDAVLGELEIAILRAFIAAPEGRLACLSLQEALFASVPGRAMPEGCAACDPKSAKATLCGGYRGVYNRILTIKRLLEFLEVGTILSPGKKFEILTEGWRLAFFEGVRVRQRKQAAGSVQKA